MQGHPHLLIKIQGGIAMIRTLVVIVAWLAAIAKKRGSFMSVVTFPEKKLFDALFVSMEEVFQ